MIMIIVIIDDNYDDNSSSSNHNSHIIGNNNNNIAVNFFCVVCREKLLYVGCFQNVQSAIFLCMHPIYV